MRHKNLTYVQKTLTVKAGQPPSASISPSRRGAAQLGADQPLSSPLGDHVIGLIATPDCRSQAVRAEIDRTCLVYTNGWGMRAAPTIYYFQAPREKGRYPLSLPVSPDTDVMNGQLNRGMIGDHPLVEPEVSQRLAGWLRVGDTPVTAYANQSDPALVAHRRAAGTPAGVQCLWLTGPGVSLRSTPANRWERPSVSRTS